MALIKCIECGKEVSDTAKNCSNCGYAILKETNETESHFGMASMIIGIISFFIDFFGLVSATGLVLSIIGLNKENDKKALATIGFFCSIIELIVKVIQIINLAAI